MDRSGRRLVTLGYVQLWMFWICHGAGPTPASDLLRFSKGSLRTGTAHTFISLDCNEDGRAQEKNWNDLTEA